MRNVKSTNDLTHRSAQLARFVQNLEEGEHVLVVYKGDTANAIRWSRVLDTDTNNPYTVGNKSQESRHQALDNTGRD